MSTSNIDSPAFTPDGRLLAVMDDPGIVRLVRVGTGKELARLAAPVECRLIPWCFTPDGTRLITLGHDRAVHIFDLAAIRRQLRELDLDWDLPPYRPIGADVPKPFQVIVDTGKLGKR